MPDFQIADRRVTLLPADVVDRLQHVEPEDIELHAVEVDGRLFPVVQALEVATGISRRETRSVRGRHVLGALGFRLVEMRPKQTTGLFLTTRRHWVFQCKPTTWDVFAWWDDQEGELREWRLYRYLDDVQPGDDAVFWIAGSEAGVYGIGVVVDVSYRSPPPKPTEAGFWLKPPTEEYWACQLNITRYLFEGPIRRDTLSADPEFADGSSFGFPAEGHRNR